MHYVSTDFNGADRLFSGALSTEWAQMDAALTALPLQLKASGQAKIAGNVIFDPVGANGRLVALLSPT